jgi:hypothetical protein
MFLSAETCPPCISVFDGDGILIKNCFEIDTETGIGVAFLDGKPMENKLEDFTILEFESGHVSRCRCEWRRPIEVRSASGYKISSPLDMLIASRFNNLRHRIDRKAGAAETRQAKHFQAIQRRLDDMMGSLKIAMYELRELKSLLPDSYQIL